MNPKQERERWAGALIRCGRALGSLPRYGSPRWCSLPDNDPRKVAAVVVAAESWWTECDRDHIEQRLRDELAVEEQLQAITFAEAAGSVRAVADRPTWARVRDRWRFVSVRCAASECSLRVDVEWCPDWQDVVAYCAAHRDAGQGVAS